MSSIVPPPKQADQNASVTVVEAAKDREADKNQGRFLCWKFYKYDRNRSQLLHLEPLCCLSSAIIREGCGFAALLEFCGALVATAIIYLEMSKRQFNWWAPLPRHSIKEFFSHPMFYYMICLHNAILLSTIPFVTLALYIYNTRLVAIKYYYCHVSLIVHLLALLFSLYVLYTPGTFKWTYTCTAFVICFSAQIVLEMWSIAVFGACKNFFKLINTFSSMR